MTIDDVKNRIKKRGYWEINFSPKKFNTERISDRKTCKEIITKSAVELRGWDYPHVPTQDDEKQAMYFGQDYLEAYIDWWAHKEAWRFYQSGQFIHYLGLWEDWTEENGWASEELKKIKPSSILSIIGNVYTLTEIFEFLKRLTLQGVYDDGVKVSIKLVGMKERKLEILDLGRVPLMMSYIARVPEITLPTKEITKEEILNKTQEFALEYIRYLFETFGWENQPIEVFKNDQKKLLERKL